MKRIILLRHAKAVSAKEGSPDFERILQNKGRLQAAEIAAHTQKKGIAPDEIISSPAPRAFETAFIFAGAFGYPADKIEKREMLYGELDEKSFLSMTGGFKPESASVMIVGHDPSMSATAKLLVKGFDESIPTSGIVVIDFATDSWNGIGKENGALVLFDFPKTDDEVYAAMTKDISKEVFEALFPCLKKTDSEAANACEKKIARWSRRIAEKFVDEVRALDKKKK
jgi:phosphohistidine phosphatase